MGKTSYELNTQENTVSQGTEQPPAYVYSNPTFSITDPDKVTTNNESIDKIYENMVTIEIESPLSEMAKFNEVPRSKGDNLKFAILVAFPVVCFVVAVVITGTNI